MRVFRGAYGLPRIYRLFRTRGGDNDMQIQLKAIEGGICAPKGYKAAGIHCGIRKNKFKKDLALITSDKRASVAAVFTTNKVKGAPIAVTRENIKDGYASAIICNSGNANTCAPNGAQIARDTCALTAEALGIDAADVIVSSTGVIGEAMSIEPFKAGIPTLVKHLSENGSDDAAHAIMTTDTEKKEAAFSFELGGKECRIAGIAKGSGMINPNMATMLCFITTDVAITPALLQKALSNDILDTFNQIWIDGDTSTNDTVALMANGMAGNAEITEEGLDYAVFCGALSAVTSRLSRKIAKDGEGASKLIECVVSGAPDKQTARIVSKSVISSNLFKAAVFGRDANWGRALCAIGYSKADFDAGNIDVVLSSEVGSVKVCSHSEYSPYSEEEASEILGADEIKVLVDLHLGDASAAAFGCDLTYEYVRINGDYRS